MTKETSWTTMEQKSIRVQIFGKEYPLRVDDEQITLQAAQRVSKMMEELHGQLPDQPPVTLAVLSALNVSEALFHEQRFTMQTLKQVEQDVSALSRMLDEALES
ncbi:MAG: cell division protein ZapA [Bacteroidota bacterium]|nr:cell division protein ZapA [Bacteroidota bacterium]